MVQEKLTVPFFVFPSFLPSVLKFLLVASTNPISLSCTVYPQATLWRILLQGVCITEWKHIMHGSGQRDQSGPPAWAQGPLSTAVGYWCDIGVVGGCLRVGAWDVDALLPSPSIHTLAQSEPLNGNAIVSPPMACPLWNMSLIWKRHAYVFMWPPVPCPRANPIQ